MPTTNKTALCMIEFSDNRLAGIVAEISESIDDCDDPDTLRRFGILLYQLHHKSRGKAWDINPKQNKTY